MPAYRRAEPTCCVASVVQYAAKPLHGLQPVSETASKIFCPRFPLGKANTPGAKFARVVGTDLFDLSFVASFRVPEMSHEFLDLRFVAGGEFPDLLFVALFGLSQMGGEFPDLLFVASFCLLNTFAVEMLNLRDPFRNKGIHPANRSGKQLGLV